MVDQKCEIWHIPASPIDQRNQNDQTHQPTKKIAPIKYSVSNQDLVWNIILPLKIVSEANCFEHWTKKRKRHLAQQLLIAVAFRNDQPKITLPCIIKLTRISPRKFDAKENLPMAFKWISDKLADLLIPGKPLGHTDSDPRIIWQFDQRKGGVKEYAIEIQIWPVDPT